MPRLGAVSSYSTTFSTPAGLLRGTGYLALLVASMMLGRYEVGPRKVGGMAGSIPAAPGRIFISYRREDTAYPAGWLYDRLADRYGGDQVFKDVDSIELGDNFIEAITGAVGSCDVLLALIGPRWLTVADDHGHRRLDDPDDFVRLEIQAALTRKVLVIPILVDGAKMPRPEELPGSLAGLEHRQALELSPARFAVDTGRLLRVLDKTLGQVQPPTGEPSKAVGIPPRPEPSAGRTGQRNRSRMLARVRSFWIDGVLKQSLHQIARVELGLETRPEAVPHPWELLVQPLDQAPQPLPSGVGITAVFDQLGQALLILGAPGAGKTTMLLELARDLLDRADQDPAHPIPVVFNLSSWAVRRRPLDKWLVDELHDRYDVPRGIGRAWVASEQVLPLLDGLDEVARTHRSACVEAINAFRDQHGLLPIAVCSRVGDYQELGRQLRLQEAILVQPLTRAQVTAYLKEAGRPLAGVRAALREDPQLWELLESPLLLSIVTLTYQGMPASAVRAIGSAEERRRHLFASYVALMLERRVRQGSSTPAQTLRWLAWLARSMRDHDQSVFYLEQLQPDWLPSRRQQWLVTTGPAVILGILVTIAMYSSLRYFSILAGLVIGAFARRRTIRPVERLEWSRSGYWRRLSARFRWGLLVGAALGALSVLSDWVNRIPEDAIIEGESPPPLTLGTSLRDILLTALAAGSIAGVIGGFVTRSISPRQAVPNQGIRRSTRRALLVLLFGFAIGIVFIIPVMATLVADFPGGEMRPMDYVGLALFVGSIAAFVPILLMPIILWAGAQASLQHLVLRLLLVRNKAAPWKYVRFLDEASDRLLLRKVGGGYVFVHRLLLDYFADLPNGTTG
jgi:DNA polymerase III delta prime subunit